MPNITRFLIVILISVIEERNSIKEQYFVLKTSLQEVKSNQTELKSNFSRIENKVNLLSSQVKNDAFMNRIFKLLTI